MRGFKVLYCYISYRQLSARVPSKTRKHDRGTRQTRGRYRIEDSELQRYRKEVPAGTHRGSRPLIVRTAKISYITGCKQRRWKGRCKTEDRIRAGHWTTACESWGYVNMCGGLKVKKDGRISRVSSLSWAKSLRIQPNRPRLLCSRA